MQFKCVRKCQYNRSIFDVGDTINVDTIVKCPDCGGKGCDKCRGTGRIDPPHHFQPVEKEKPVEYVDAPKADGDLTPIKGSPEEAAAIANIQKIFDERGIAYDKRWSLTRLQNELKKAEKEGK